MAATIGIGPLLTPGLRAEFQNVYQPRYEGLMSRMTPFIRTVPSDKIKEIYGYILSAIYPKRWDRGNMIDAKNILSNQFSLINRNWGRRIYYHFDDIGDAQVGNLVAVARNLGKNWATLPERIFYQILNAATDNDLLPTVPNAPDGSAMFIATTRFGRSGGNTVTLTGVTTAQQVITDLNAVEQGFSDFQDTESQPFWDPSEIERGLTVFYGTAQTLVMKQAIKQMVQPIAASTATSNAGVSNVLQDSGMIINLVRSQHITATQYFCLLNSAPDELKPIIRQVRQGLLEMQGNWEVSDHTRDTGEHYVQFYSREGYMPNLPLAAFKVV